MAEQEPQFDRQVFVQRQAPAPRQSSSVPGLLLLIVVAVVIGLGAYALIKGGHLPLLPPENPDLTQIAQKLDEIEKRIEQLEKRRKAEPAPPPAKNEPTPPSTPAASPPPQAEVRVDPGTRRQRDFTPANPAQEKRLGEQDRRLAEMQKDVGTIRGDVAAGREAWEATTDRLGSVSGEVSSQRGEITRNRQSLNQLAARFERTRLPFRLQKRAGAQRVGPVWLELGGTDSKKQRYTMRLFVDDKWVEMKDRALHEPVEFYVGGGSTAAELVVSQIYKDEVVGYLALPQEGTKR